MPGLSEKEREAKIAEDTKAAKKIAAAKAAIKILKIAAELNYGKKFVFPKIANNHYMLTLTFCPPKKGVIEVPREEKKG